MENLFNSALIWLKGNPAYATWAAGVGTLILAMVGIFVIFWNDYWKKRFIKPDLRAEWNVDRGSFRDETFQENIKFNFLLIIHNYGSLTAKNAFARVEKLVFVQPAVIKDGMKNIWYHPTPLNWSGQYHGAPVDIYRDTTFFLDFILSFDERTLINECNTIPNDVVNYLVNLDPNRKDYFWQIWLNTRGAVSAPVHFYCYGEVEIYFHLACDDAPTKKYVATINWNRPTPIPSVSLKKL
ncbi:MAG: hypothetical protein KKE29_21600 [Proteobacteria bacterium]|nr:hypothetical protein [Pseudomonadota bacterium]MBU4600187.1 hypothetical protein [Pseudomonadota bacterium]MBV1718069.1 hypothetical protein [Desulfarculus sp.]